MLSTAPITRKLTLLVRWTSRAFGFQVNTCG